MISENPCQDCGTDGTETLQRLGRWLCETCFNAANCGCQVCLEEAGK